MKELSDSIIFGIKLQYNIIRIARNNVKKNDNVIRN